MITLNPIAITDLNARFARREGNKITHYVVSYADFAYGNKTAWDAVREYIMETEKVNEVVLAEVPEFKPTHDGNIFNVQEVDISLDKKTKKVLLKRKAHSLLYEWNHYNTFYDKWLDRLGYHWNSHVVYPLNRYLMNNNKLELSNRLFKYAYSPRYIRKLDPIRFLSVMYEEPNEKEAFQKLANDLKTLRELKLIKGHLCMPSVIELADTIGSGNKLKAVFCFPIVCSLQLEKLGVSADDWFKLPLNRWISSETHEGSSGEWAGEDPHKKYQIEEVKVPSKIKPVIEELVKQSYEGSREWVNKVAKHQNDALKAFDKDSNSSTEIQRPSEPGLQVTKTTVSVNVNMVKKPS